MASCLYSVLVLAIVAASISHSYAITEEQREAIKEKVKADELACGAEHGFSMEQVKQWSVYKKTPDDTNKCFIACMMKKGGLLNDQGMYAENNALEKIKTYAPGPKQEEFIKSAKACSSVNEQSVSDGSAGCDRAVLLVKCIQEQKELLDAALNLEH